MPSLPIRVSSKEYMTNMTIKGQSLGITVPFLGWKLISKTTNQTNVDLMFVYTGETNSCFPRLPKGKSSNSIYIYMYVYVSIFSGICSYIPIKHSPDPWVKFGLYINHIANIPQSWLISRGLATLFFRQHSQVAAAMFEANRGRKMDSWLSVEPHFTG